MYTRFGLIDIEFILSFWYKMTELDLGTEEDILVLDSYQKRKNLTLFL